MIRVVLFLLFPLATFVLAFLLLRFSGSGLRNPELGLTTQRKYFWGVGLVSLILVTLILQNMHSLPIMGFGGYMILCGVCIAGVGYCIGTVVYKNLLVLPAIVYPIFWALLSPVFWVVHQLFVWILFGTSSTRGLLG